MTGCRNMYLHVLGDRYTWFFFWGIHWFRYTIGLLQVLFPISELTDVPYFSLSQHLQYYGLLAVFFCFPISEMYLLPSSLDLKIAYPRTTLCYPVSKTRLVGRPTVGWQTYHCIQLVAFHPDEGRNYFGILIHEICLVPTCRLGNHLQVALWHSLPFRPGLVVRTCCFEIP